MADNYLERQYAAYEARKAQVGKGGKKQKPSQKNRFYTRPVITQTHEERQLVIAAQIAKGREETPEAASQK